MYVEEGYLENIESVECQGPPVLHLPDSACIKNMKIQDTNKVVVSVGSRERKCGEYHLFVKNTTMTALPRATTHLHAIRSHFYKMTLHPKMKHVSVVNSEVSILATDKFLNDSVVVNITETKVHYVQNLTASNNSKVQFVSSDIAYLRLDRTTFQGSASLAMVDSKVRTGDTYELLVPPGVSVALDRLDSKLEIRAINVIPELGILESPDSCKGVDINTGSTTNYYVGFVLLCISTIVLTLLLFMKCKVKTSCLLKHIARETNDSNADDKRKQESKGDDTITNISLNNLFEQPSSSPECFTNDSFSQDAEIEKITINEPEFCKLLETPKQQKSPSSVCIGNSGQQENVNTQGDIPRKKINFETAKDHPKPTDVPNNCDSHITDHLETNLV